MPKRIQRRRSRGWQKPPHTVYVGRSTKWRNPFTIKQAQQAGYETASAVTVYAYRQWLLGDPIFNDHDHYQQRRLVLNGLDELRGLDLCCDCAPGEPCHADVLLELANDPSSPRTM